MDKDAVIATLRAHRAELERHGVIHAGLFGSLARGEAGPASDIDIALDFAPGQPTDVYAYVGTKQLVESLFPRRVDVVDHAALKPRVLAGAGADIIYAF